MQTVPGWTPFTVVEDRKDYTVFAVLSPTNRDEFRFLVEWDADRDQRVLGAALSLYYRRPELFQFVLCWREQKAQLVVDVVQHVMARPKDGRPMLSPSLIEVHRALQLLSDSQSFAIGFDRWTVEAQPARWPITPDDRLFEIHRLYNIGMQSTPWFECAPIGDGSGFTVVSLPEAKVAKNGGTLGQPISLTFGTLEEAMSAPFLSGAVTQMIKIGGGYFVRQKGSPWEFHESQRDGARR